ncbi:MAG: hypothetical protein N2316_02100 [Spirochaetes bacterium]|nr:hypothetical protein [Spirochaetota bacterium]
MKFFRAIIIFVFVLPIMLWCKKATNRYAEVREYLKKSIAIQEEYLRAIENAKNQKDVASAINVYAEKLKAIHPIMQELVVKYPEIVSEKEVPDELKDIMEEQNRLAAKIHEASMKNVIPYNKTPEVIEATKNLANVMGEE